MNFYEKRDKGYIGEIAVAEWLKKHGCGVIPLFRIEEPESRGPRLLCPNDDYVLPDILCFCNKETIWVEVKNFCGFTRHRKTGDWTVGFKRSQFEEYKNVQYLSPWPVFMFFIMGENGEAPTGLYGDSLRHLTDNVHHYWEDEQNDSIWFDENIMTKKAELSELEEVYEKLPKICREV